MLYEYSDTHGIMLNATNAVRDGDTCYIKSSDQYYMVAERCSVESLYEGIPDRLHWNDEVAKSHKLDDFVIRSRRMHVEEELSDVIITYFYTNGGAISISMSNKVVIPIDMD